MIGFGNVGQGFATLLNLKSKFLRENFAVKPKVVAIVDSQGAAVNPNGLNLKVALSVKRLKGTIAYYPQYGRLGVTGLSVLEDVDAEIVVEMTPTNIVNSEPGLSFMLEAMKRGRHVITSNKGPLALAFSKLYGASRRYGVQFKFDATVGGATPVISLVKQCLKGNEIKSIRGILNATSNFILTRMGMELCSMEKAIEEAQRIGICESKPTLDIKGIDAACKLVILANTIMNRGVTYWDLQKVEGIENIGIEQLLEARKRGCAIKLIGLADKSKLLVQPMPIPLNSYLCVDGILNAVEFKTDLAKEVAIIGRGAGSIETASKIFSNLIDIVETMEFDKA